MPTVPRLPVRTQLFKIGRSFSRLAASSHIVFSVPLKSKPNSVFSVGYCPSCLISFFSAMESLLSTASPGENAMDAGHYGSRRRSCSWDTRMTRLMKSSTYTWTMYRNPLLFAAHSGRVAYSASPTVYFSNLCVGSDPTSISMYSILTSLAVSVAAQKYGGDSTHPICSDVGITSFIGSPSGCGTTYAKFYSSPSSQSMRQNPSLIFHFAIKTLAFWSASANA